MEVSANASLPKVDPEALIALLVGGVFAPPTFEWLAFSGVLFTSGGAYDGYGSAGYFYDKKGMWEAADFGPDDTRTDDLVEAWTRASYQAARPWNAALFQLVRDGEAARLRIEFEFDG